MPSRISRSSLPTTKPKSAKARSRKRTLNAFSIAAAQEEAKNSVTRTKRLGELADGPSKKRSRGVSEDIDSDVEDEDAPPRRRMKPSRSQAQEDVSEESDSDGNRWQLGHVDEDNDTDIDSDEAFDSEDEERFAHFSFSASTSKRTGSSKKQKTANGNLNLQEGENTDEGSDEDDSLGEDAVDLAQMLDDYSEDGDNSSDEKMDGSSSDDAIEESSDSSEDNEDEPVWDSSEDEDVEGEQLNKLQSLVTSLHPGRDDTKKRTADLYNSQNPSVAGPVATEKFDIRDLFNSSDPQLAKMSRKLGNLPKTPTKDPKLAPSLPKRQKDQIDRVAANEKANRTLERWVDSVKHMRRAEHVQFPLQDPEKDLPREPEHLLPALSTTPLNALESTVNNILLESGLAPVENERSGDELPDNGVTVQEVLARRAELRRARDLVFREEKKAKRIKKIKSKSYRRVHRKERERLAALEEGSGMDEDDREAHDRRRAEERIGSKHRDSKWAKQMKKSGRSLWDDEARSGVTEMARRGNELRKRIAGKMDGNGSNDSESSDGDVDADHDDEDAEQRYLTKTLDALGDDNEVDDKGSKLNSMKFMQRAENALKAQNEEALERLRRDMNGEESTEDSDADNIGRKIFGPSERREARQVEERRNEFEEPDFSEADDFEDEPGPLIDPTGESGSIKSGAASKVSSLPTKEAKNTRKKENSTKPKDSSPSNGLNREVLSKPDADGWVTVTYEHDSDEEDSGNDKESIISQTEILRRAFAGDDVEDDFEKEKQGVVADEDEQIIDNTMAGWGSWVGEGVSKRELKRAKGKVLSKQEGIKPENRKDARLKNVIINHKRVRKNVDYLASTLPFPYNSRAEYERSIRMPIGTEWNVKQTYQENTKPRVLVKPGAIVAPMGKPLV
jgi:U3 small nucleolar RNA-associated protein 14